MVVLVITSGPMLMDSMIIVHIDIIVRVLSVLVTLLYHLWGLTITVSQELVIHTVGQLTTSMTVILLWGGSGCITSRCCDNPTQPWFYRELSGTTTSSIETRICHIDGFSIGIWIYLD